VKAAPCSSPAAAASPAVVVFAVLMSAGLACAGSAFHRLQAVEHRVRRVTALVVIVGGLYYTWTFTIQGGSSLWPGALGAKTLRGCGHGLPV
jgi:hypothetical protein